MKPILILATRNRNKIREIREILPDLAIDLRPLDDFPGAPEVIEGDAALEDNAARKAKSAALFCGHWALADDTGLEVDFLDGRPGALSARYAGPGCSPEDNNRKLLAALGGVPRRLRAARFRCAAALASPGGSSVVTEGRLEGFIALEPSGGGGFGYDPLFALAGAVPARTLAELSAAEKNAVSHRAAALNKMLPYLRRLARHRA